MRIRLLFVGAAVALVALLGPTSAAFAQEGEESEPGQTQDEGEVDPGSTEEEEGGESEITHEAEECIHILEEGGEVDECQEAPSPILPADNELIWGAISFAVLFAALAKFGFPALRKGMEDRSNRIREDLDKAENAKSEAESLKAEYESQLKGAKEEANRLREEARAEVEEYKAQRRQEIDEEMAEYRSRARSEADAAKEQAMADVRAEVADLAIAAAEQVVQKSLDRETNVELVERYIDQVQSRG